ncbi:MAG: hypothetical protein KDI46_03375 [Alphaproteobacteria bacterium]|nr:hypothetical protein [Alphaproteobacteria bacterium]
MNPFISLSLFVILLSFFIILNAHSSYDETKARPILNSLSMVFTNQQSPADINASETNRKGASEGQGNSIDKIEGLFSSEIAGVKAKQNRMGTELRMRLPFSVFEQKIMSSLSGNAAVGPAGQQAFFLPTLVSLLDLQDKKPYKMEMVVHASAADSLERQSAAKRLSAISSKMEGAGLPKKLITIGLSDDADSSVIDIYFHRYHPVSNLDTERVGGGS